MVRPDTYEFTVEGLEIPLMMFNCPLQFFNKDPTDKRRGRVQQTDDGTSEAQKTTQMRLRKRGRGAVFSFDSDDEDGEEARYLPLRRSARVRTQVMKPTGRRSERIGGKTPVKYVDVSTRSHLVRVNGI